MSVAFKQVAESDHKKKLRVLALFIGLIVFVQIPYYFDNVKDTGNEKDDAVLEAGYDTVRAAIRAVFAWISFLVGGLMIALS